MAIGDDSADTPDASALGGILAYFGVGLHEIISKLVLDDVVSVGRSVKLFRLAASKEHLLKLLLAAQSLVNFHLN